MFGGADQTRVHMHGWHVRIFGVDDHRYAGGPEPWVISRTRHTGSKLWREFAMNGGAMNPCFFKQFAVEQSHGAAAAILRAAPRGFHKMRI